MQSSYLTCCFVLELGKGLHFLKHASSYAMLYAAEFGEWSVGLLMNAKIGNLCECSLY